VRALHHLIADTGWDAASELDVQLGDELTPLLNLLSQPAPETAPGDAEESLVTVTLKHDHAVNGVRYGPGWCEVPLAIAAGLEHADRQAEYQRRRSPVLQDRGE
jgi:hypothetical protein